MNAPEQSELPTTITLESPDYGFTQDEKSKFNLNDEINMSDLYLGKEEEIEIEEDIMDFVGVR